MTFHIRAHFDGRFLVPDQPVNLPLNQPLDVEVTLHSANGNTNGTPLSNEVIQDRLRKLQEFFQRPPLGEVSLDALRRENMYDERP